MTDQAPVIQIAANASSSDVHDASITKAATSMRSQHFGFQYRNRERKTRADGKSILHVLVGMADA
jgi:hypothetical protein